MTNRRRQKLEDWRKTTADLVNATKNKAATREVRRERHTVTACPLCDGCGKLIATKTFFKYYFRESGEDAWGGLDQELHSCNRPACIGKVVNQIFEQA
jgi:hypothetical protein